ncbi:ATP-grasp domain-containing protein [Streptomyces sp. NPDC048290]|uniref:carboxylate--amine ligase n=1 Tax=Streptomyces sp. NPDC048290 TaxID=3155811 RepID=UPI00342A1EB3
MAERTFGVPVDVDRDVPGLIVKFGGYPLHHGGVGAIRSLGRLGVPMYAITEDPYTPAAASRYLTRAFVWPTTGAEDPDRLVEGLLRIGRRIGRPAVLIPTDEEAAVLIAERRADLAGPFLAPPVAPDLPRRLASKQTLHELCGEHGMASPRTVVPASYDDIAAFAEHAVFPVVAKNREAFVRRRRPAVPGTTRIMSRADLLALARDWCAPDHQPPGMSYMSDPSESRPGVRRAPHDGRPADPGTRDPGPGGGPGGALGGDPGVVLQEYLPRESAEDWIVHGYLAADATPLALFTGVKVRSWPPHAGMTAHAYVVANPELADLAARFLQQIGFTGVFDLDLRFDRRDGQYKLLDFNPRMGAQFRLFESGPGVDVVRALHLDLTGRPVPGGAPPAGRRYVVENIDLPALLAYRRSGYTTPHAPPRATGTELAWLAPDDPLPFATMLARLVRPGAKHLYHLWRTHRPGDRRPGRPRRSDAPSWRTP